MATKKKAKSTANKKVEQPAKIQVVFIDDDEDDSHESDSPLVAAARALEGWRDGWTSVLARIGEHETRLAELRREAQHIEISLNAAQEAFNKEAYNGPCPTPPYAQSGCVARKNVQY